MTIEKLPTETAALLGYTHRVALTNKDLTQSTANTAQAITIRTAPIGLSVSDCAVRVKTPFKNSADAAFNSTTITVGDGGSAVRYIASTQVNANGAVVPFAVIPAANSSYVYTAADNITITFTPMAAKALSSLDTGELIVLFRMVEIYAVD